MVRLLTISCKIYFLGCAVLSLVILWHVLSSKEMENLTNGMNETHNKVDRFYVNSAKCQVPYVEPFNAEVMKVYKPMPFIPCTNKSDLITVHYDRMYNQYVLHVNKEVVHEEVGQGDIACFYQKIIYGRKADVFDSIGSKTQFYQSFLVPVDIEGMLVECRTANEQRVLQKDAFVLVQYQKKPKEQPRKSVPDRQASVIMYGIDTVSRTNLRRTMPMVHEFLKSPGWYEMMGYNKVADNSFPNIFAMLTGYSPETAKAQVCDTDIDGCLDKIPFIWKEMREAGYLTAYAEDEEIANTFTYMKPGFSVKPTDYYFRPFLVALENHTEVKYCEGCLMKYCLGRRLANSYIYDYCRQFMQRFVAERPVWGMFWSNHFSHDNVFMLSAMEHKVLTDLLNFERDGAFEHTIMIFFSDHGARFGPLMHMKEAFLEERLPIMFIYLPPWFREKYPMYVRALELNQHRLSSNFDLYSTLKHILKIDGKADGWSYDCPQCQSLLLPLPENRNCSQAGITEPYCTCHKYEEVRETDWTRRMAIHVVERINQYLWQHNMQERCSNLTLRVVNATEQRVDNLDGDTNLTGGLRHYHTKFQVHQNLGEFFATTLYDRETEALELNVELISRTNMYGNDSECVRNKIVKLYCICLEKLWT